MAQAYEQEAIDKLCEHFKPLVYKEAYRLTVYNALGEDAVNTAWLIFLRFIHRYQGNAYNHLPGLIKYHLHYGLLRQVRKQGRSWDNEVASEELMKMQTHEHLEQPLEILAIKQVLSTLPTKQFKILKMYYGQGKNNKQIAEQLSCSISTIKRQKLDALNRIKEKFNT